MYENYHVAARIGCLRKYIEHQYVNPRDDSSAYNIFSSLVHGRQAISKDNAGNILLEDNELFEGNNYIKEFISDFDYSNLLIECAPENLIRAYMDTEKTAYERLLILRFYVERDEAARKRLRDYNDVLRKYVDETFHIENDYLYSLDVRKFNIVPEEYNTYAERFVANEVARYDFQ